MIFRWRVNLVNRKCTFPLKKNHWSITSNINDWNDHQHKLQAIHQRRVLNPHIKNKMSLHLTEYHYLISSSKYVQNQKNIPQNEFDPCIRQLFMKIRRYIETKLWWPYLWYQTKNPVKWLRNKNHTHGDHCNLLNYNQQGSTHNEIAIWLPVIL